MKWLSKQFPQYFEPSEASAAKELWGAGQYMDYRGNEGLDEYWRQLNLTLNWDATFPWPWWGNYMPAVELGTLAAGQDGWLDCIPVGHNAPVADGAENASFALFLAMRFDIFS